MEAQSIEQSNYRTNPAAEQALVRRAMAGETAAFEALVMRFTGMVYAIAFARVGDRDSAEDLVQEVFLRAYAGLRSLQEPRYFATWLSRIARNLATDWQRSGKRRSEAVALVSMEDIRDMDDPAAVGARDQIAAQQQWNILHEALRRLSADQREIVLLHYSEEWSLTEISERLRVHRTTVSRHLDQALATLRSDIAPILREGCKSARPPARLGNKAAAAVAAFAILPVASRAAVISEFTAKSGAAHSVGSVGGASTGATIFKLTGAATAAGGKIVMTKTAVTGACVVAGLICAGFYAKHRMPYLFNSPTQRTSTAGRSSSAPPVFTQNSYPPNTVLVKPATSKWPRMSSGMGKFEGTVDLVNAIGNAYKEYDPGTVIYNTTVAELKDIVITAPSGHPDQLPQMMKNEIPKAFGVTTRSEERTMDVYILTAPEGTKHLQSGGAGHGTSSGAKEIKFDGTDMAGVARAIASCLKAPVINETGLQGRFTGKATGDLRIAENVLKAVREQLGLELRAEKRTMKILVVDKAA